MNRSFLATLFFATSLLALAAGCTVEEVSVRGPRPPERVEVVTARPSPRHTWVRGRWEHRGDGWVWIDGAWVIR